MSKMTPPPGRVRKPKTRSQKDAAALASERYRDRKKALGIPPVSEIDSALGRAFMRVIMRQAEKNGRTEVFDKVAWMALQMLPTGRKGESVMEAIEKRMQSQMKAGLAFPLPRRPDAS